MNKFERMRQLVDELNKYAYMYYVQEKPIVSDYDYDIKYDELLALEKELNVVLSNSPTVRVGGETLDGFKKVEHKVKLYSLNKCNNFDGIKKFVQDVNEVTPNPKFVVEYKFDGLRIIAHYKNGLLVQASTRGNGFVGEDVTEQVKTIKSVPLSIDFKGDLTVAGEGVITLANLEKYNKTADEKLKNARNAVAGAIRNLDPKVTAKRNLDVVFYDLINIEGKTLSSQEEVNTFLKSNGFLTGKLFKVVSTAEEIMQIASEIDPIKTTLDIQIDGLVIKLDSIPMRDELGYTAKFPKWAIAYKFAPVELTSTIKDVVWNVGRTGKVTPIALIDPVELSGATVARATLNNFDDIERKKVKIGALVFVRRSNEVIPEILGLAQDNENSRPIEKPTTCPCCGSFLKEVGPNVFCFNPTCKDKIVSKLAYFASRNCMNIEGLSDKIVEQLYSANLVKSVCDLYRLKADDLQNLEGFKDKKINNLLMSVDKSKTCNLSNFLDALSIDGVGEKTSKDIAKRFLTLDKVMSATENDFLLVKDIGTVTAKNLVTYFANENNVNEINCLLSLGVKVLEKEEKSVDTSNFFYGKKFVLTGVLESYKRSDAGAKIEALGGEVAGSVSKLTDYVIYGEGAGSKLEKARALNVKTLNEDEFLEELAKCEQ